MPFIGVYEQTREYGGPEEGGWHYEHYDHIESMFCVDTPEDVAFTKATLKEKHADREYGQLWSVNGGLRVTCFTEEYPGEYQTQGKPHYE